MCRPGETKPDGVGRNYQQTFHDELRELDLRAFGADRSQLLAKLARRNLPLLLGNSYLFSRPGRVTSYLGPCMCGRSGSARTLMEGALQTHSASGWSCDLLCENANAVVLARALGFTPNRHLTRMVRGKELRANECTIYAIAGFELG